MSSTARLCSILASLVLAGAATAQDSQPFIMDVLCFAADIPDSNARLDVWTIVPYAALSFRPTDTAGFSATYVASIAIRDSTGTTIRQRLYRRTLTAPTYAIAQGATAAFDRLQTVEHLPEGVYTITVAITEEATNRTYQLTRRYRVPDYRRPELALSSILIASAVEETSERPLITPYFDDNLAQLDSPFFAIAELYAHYRHDSLEVLAELLSPQHTLLATLARKILPTVEPGRQILILPLTLPAELPTGSQLLRIRLLSAGSPVAQSERSVRFLWSFWGRTVSDLEQAIRQLRYVATQEQIDSILAAPTSSEKRRRFEAFWALLDPTPGTLRNEAFEEYYDRIAQANRLFRSYTEGWLTDRGMVYVIFGPPLRREQFQSNGRSYERWIYSDREVLFVDYTGFEDYRLLTPLPPGTKYRYRGT